MSTSDQLIDAVIAREGDGAYSDHPADRGGPTRWGVTEQVARAFGYAGAMRELPRAEAVRIYRARYWDAPGLERVAARDAALAAELFDAAVNMGPARAGGFLQRALNLLNAEARLYPDVVADGAIGALTLHALDGFLARRGAEGHAVLLWLVRALRAERYADIAEHDGSQEAFLYGWIARLVRQAVAA